MAISVRDRKHLWGRAGNQCAFPACPQLLVEELPNGAGIATVGEEAHVRSSRTNGPRYDPDFPVSELDEYGNLILLCPTHHTIIDANDGDGWAVPSILTIKAEHEARVANGMSDQDRAKLHYSENIAARVDGIALNLFPLFDGAVWGLNQAVPRIRDEAYQRMVALGTSLLAADWPPESPHLAAAVTRLQRVVAALTRAIAYSFELNDGGTLVCVRGYKRLESWDPDAYERLSGQFELNRAVVYALVAELTRTANLFIDGVRMDIDPLFRTVEGRALTVEGDGVVFDVVHIRLEYGGVDWSTIAAFPDLDSIRERLKSEVQELDIELSELDFHSLEFR